MHKFSLEKKPSEMGWTLGVTKLVSWLWLATDSPVYLQIGECLEQKAPSVACHYAEATQKHPLDVMTRATVPFFPKGRVRELSTWPRKGFLSCAEHIITFHLTWTVLLKGKLKGKER